MFTEQDKQDFIEKALADTTVESGNYHATYGGHQDSVDCWCEPRGESIGEGKAIYWHNKAQKPLSSKNGFADPAESWPFAPDQVEIVGDDKIIHKDFDGAEHSEIRS